MKRQILAKDSAAVSTAPKPDLALGIKPQILAGNEHELAISLRDLGLILRGEGKLAEAEGLYREALATFRRASGDRHPDVAFTLAWLAKLLSEEERLAEAETAFRDALAIQRKLYDSESLTVADTLLGLSGVLQKEGKLAEAESASREALAILEKKKPDDWETFDKRSILGGILLEQNKYAEAEPLLVSAYEGLTQRKDKLPPRGKLRPKEVLQRVVQLYEATSRPDQAAEWKRKLAEANALLEGQTNTPAEKKSEPR